jgi:hypothetical protein
MHKTVGESILTVCNALKKFQVEYLIADGTAVAMYGYFRWSHKPSGEVAEKFDLDIWYNPTYENYFKLLNALEHLGQDVDEFRKDRHLIQKNLFSNLNLKNLLLIFCPN